MRRVMPIGIVITMLGLGCDRAPSKAEVVCKLEEVPQASALMRVPTCRETEMRVAYAMCERTRPAVPTGEVHGLRSAEGMSVDECLRHWVAEIDRCKDEEDRQWAPKTER